MMKTYYSMNMLVSSQVCMSLLMQHHQQPTPKYPLQIYPPVQDLIKVVQLSHAKRFERLN